MRTLCRRRCEVITYQLRPQARYQSRLYPSCHTIHSLVQQLGPWLPAQALYDFVSIHHLETKQRTYLTAALATAQTKSSKACTLDVTRSEQCPQNIPNSGIHHDPITKKDSGTIHSSRNENTWPVLHMTISIRLFFQSHFPQTNRFRICYKDNPITETIVFQNSSTKCRIFRSTSSIRARQLGVFLWE